MSLLATTFSASTIAVGIALYTLPSTSSTVVLDRATVVHVLGCAWLACLAVAATLQRAPAPKPVEPEVWAELAPAPRAAASAGALYLDMLKRVLLNLPYHEQSYQVALTRSEAEGRRWPELTGADFELKWRMAGEDLSLNTLSMVGMRRLDNVQSAVETVLKEGVAGDLIETGCAKGGACILMRATLRANKEKGRRVLCCDTFCDAKPPPRAAVAMLFRPIYQLVVLLSYLPLMAWHRWLYAALMRLQHSFPVDMDHLSDDTVRSFLFLLRRGQAFLKPPTPTVGASLAHVKSNFARLGLLDEQVVFVKGFFAETLPDAPVDEIALLRLDGDMYASTMDALVHLYPKLTRGGYCIVDDYHSFIECREAIDEYRAEHGITEPLVQVDNMCVYWRRA